MAERDRQALEDVLRYGGELSEYMQGVSLEAFGADRRLQLVAERLLEIIGDVTDDLSEHARKAVPVDWRAVGGLRHVLAHQDGRVDVARLYTLVAEDLPELLDRVGEALEV